MAVQPHDPTSHRQWHRHALAMMVLAGLAFWVMFPLWLAPASRIGGMDDLQLNGYILSWGRFALFHQIREFFHANVFWPHAYSLAYGEHMLTQVALVAPFSALARNTVALLNLSLLQGYLLSAVAAYMLGYHYFRSAGAATLTGMAYGYAAYRVYQFSHLQLIHGEFLPLMILGFERALQPSGRRWGWLLGAAALGQWLASWYWAVFTLWVFAPYALARLWGMRRQLTGRNILAVAAPLVVAGVLTLMTAQPYLFLLRNHNLIRPPEAVKGLAARPTDFLVPTPRSLLYGKLGPTLGLPEAKQERALFPGLFILIGLGGACVLALKRKGKNVDEGGGVAEPDGTERETTPRFPLRLWLGISLMLLVFSFGDRLEWSGADGKMRTLLLPWGAVGDLPINKQMRVPARWMLPALLGLALLGAEVWRRLRGGAGSHPARKIGALALGCLLGAECLTRPIAAVDLPPERPPVYEWLERQTFPAPVLLVPTFHSRLPLEAAWHHQPMLNGTNGYFPPLQIPLLLDLERRFPHPQACEDLRQLGIRHVIVDLGEAGHKDARWNAENVTRTLAGLAPSMPVRQFGEYLAIELGGEERDMGKIKETFARLTERLPKVKMGAQNAP